MELKELIETIERTRSAVDILNLREDILEHLRSITVKPVKGSKEDK